MNLAINSFNIQNMAFCASKKPYKTNNDKYIDYSKILSESSNNDSFVSQHDDIDVKTKEQYERQVGSYMANYHLQMPVLEQEREDLFQTAKTFYGKYNQLFDYLAQHKEIYSDTDSDYVNLSSDCRLYLKKCRPSSVSGNLSNIPTRIIYKRTKDTCDIYDFKQGLVALGAKRNPDNSATCDYLIFSNDNKPLTVLDDGLLFSRYKNMSFVAKNVSLAPDKSSLIADYMTMFSLDNFSEISRSETYSNVKVSYDGSRHSAFDITSDNYLLTSHRSGKSKNLKYAKGFSENYDHETIQYQKAQALIKPIGKHYANAKIDWFYQPVAFDLSREKCDYSKFVYRDF
ncbi:MAG: hypothetical protein IJ877_07655 [Candidatus Gastranaerophilales bacterium]|nr:hypothetical protein [Candidatus Gastranaerophilales bacterium]